MKEYIDGYFLGIGGFVLFYGLISIWEKIDNYLYRRKVKKGR